MTQVTTDKAPAPIGPYSQGRKAGGFLFVSGQVPVNPQTQEKVAGDIAAQTKQTLENLKAVIEAGGADISQVVKVNVYLADLADFGEFNEVYKDFFGDPKPARTTIGCSLPGISVEIDAIVALEN